MGCLILIEDDAGNEIAAVAEVIDKYLLPDGAQMFVNVIPVWCQSCRKIVAAESLQNPNEMERGARRILEELPKSAVFPPHILADHRPPQLVRRLHNAAQWKIALERRKSPPRCLECGGTDFLPIATAPKWINHPQNPQRKIRVRRDTVYADLARAGRLYDVAGNRIPGRFADSGT